MNRPCLSRVFLFFFAAFSLHHGEFDAALFPVGYDRKRGGEQKKKAAQLNRQLKIFSI